MKCEDCLYWAPHPGNTGDCRRHAPVVFQSITGNLSGYHLGNTTGNITSFPTTAFPVTTKDQWCGAFEDKNLRRENIHELTGYDS